MNNPVVADRPLEPLGFYQFAVSTSPLGLPSVPPDASYAYIQAQVGLIRWRDDGTAPTGTSGHLFDNLDDLWYIGDLHKFQVIRDSGESGSTELSVTYYKVA